MIEKQVAAQPSLVADRMATWSSWSPQLRSVLRIVAAFMFIQFGTMKLFAFPIGMPPDGGTAPLLSQMGLACVLETFGGALILLGLFTPPVAFVLAGEMAVAYFLVSAPLGFWTIINGSTVTVLFCFLWLYLSAAGAGPWSLDAWRGAEPDTALPRGARAPMRQAGAG
jgi:putative oxidoreductase